MKLKPRKIWKHRWLIAIALLTLWGFWWYHEGKQRKHDAAIIAAGRQYGVDPALIKAVVWRESSFDPHVRGRAGEIGLMQIMPDTGKDWAKAEKVHVYSLYDPGTNTKIGAWYLARLLRNYRNTDNPVPYALAAYNAGPRHATEWATGPAATSSSEFVSRITFPSTRRYIEAITDKYASYKPNFPPKPEQ
jgi:soluble lytic murein transglycosylase